MDVNATLNQVIAAIEAGRRAEARQLLETILDVEERNEQAWLWLGKLAAEKEEQIICLENVLISNPNNQEARDRLTELRSPDPTPAHQQAAPTTDNPRLIDNRAFIAITIALAVMLIITVVSILVFVVLTPPA